MSDRILNFREFSSEFLNESSTNVNPATVEMEELLKKVNQNSEDVAAALRKMRDKSAGGDGTGTGTEEKPASYSSVSNIGQIKAIDLLLATPAGAGIARFLSENPDYVAQNVADPRTVSDSPDLVSRVAAALRNPSRKDEFDKNVEAINKVSENDDAVIAPKADLLPRSSDYDYKGQAKSWKKSRGDNPSTMAERWDSMQSALKGSGYSIDPDDVTLVAVRNYLSNKKGHGNHFTDWIIVMSPEKDKKVGVYEATTTPGPMYLAVPFRNWYVASNPNNSINPKGLAIVNPGKYSYKVGTHNGYKALVQDGNVSVSRYKPVLDPSTATMETFSPGNTESGKFGINIHRGRSSGETSRIDDYSAGCLVFSKARDLNSMLDQLSDNDQKKVDVILLQLGSIDNSDAGKIEKVIAASY